MAAASLPGRMAFALLALGISLAGFAAHAAVSRFDVLLDADHDATSGCAVSTPAGTLAGFDRRLVTLVTTTTTAGTVSSVVLESCAGGTFGNATALGGGWPLGRALGTVGTDVVETFVPRALLGPTAMLRIAVVASGPGGTDVLVHQGSPLVTLPLATAQAPHTIPALAPAALAALAACVGLAAAWALRRRGASAHVAFAWLALAVATAAWAAMVRDGDPSDWIGIAPVASDARGDAGGGPDLAALFVHADAGELSLRIDAAVPLDTSPPPPPVNVAPVVDAGPDQSIVLPALAQLAGTASDDGLPNPPGALTIAWQKVSGPGSVTFASPDSPVTTAAFGAAGVYVLRLSASDGALAASDDVTVSVAEASAALPPPPESIAPPLLRVGIPDFLTGIEFLYTAPTPVQQGVAPNAIHPLRAAVIKGRVLDGSGAPLPGVRISILGQPQFGRTQSRADGRFDLAVNGGGALVVRYEKAGHFEAQRVLALRWQDYAFAPDVVLLQPDPVAVPVALGGPAMQVARGRSVTDTDGTRRPTLLFPAGTTAQFRLRDGSAVPAPATITVRQTEYTEGPLGPLAMPSELPPTSGFTYYLELSADEAIAAGATSVEFSQPVVFYLENFFRFPVGDAAPVGFWDRTNGRWVAEPNGYVVKIVGVTAGAADLDTDGDGFADPGTTTGSGGSDLGITLDERRALASLYAVGQELWRVATRHFSPGDINWPYGPPADATGPNGGSPARGDRDKKDCNECGCKRPGSIIECPNQTLAEAIPVVGTPYALHYASDRVPGRRDEYRIDIPVTGASVPASLKRVEVEIQVAGQRHVQTFPAVAAQSMTFEWDGRDGYGRLMQGKQWANVRVRFVYPAVWQRSARDYRRAWAVATGVVRGGASPTRGETSLYVDWRLPVGAFDAREPGVAGWTLSVHHAYDPLGKVLYLGDGSRRSDVDSLAPIIATVAGNGASGSPADGARAVAQPLPPGSVAAAPDGSVFIAHRSDRKLYRLDPATGLVHHFAGDGSDSGPLEGSPARNVRIGTLEAGALAVGPDGSVYVANLHRIRRIAPDGSRVETIAGTGAAGFSGDGGPALAAQLNRPVGLAVAADGSVFVMDYANFRVRRVGADGTIVTVAGTGANANPVEGPALASPLQDSLDNIAVAPDGSLIIPLGLEFGLGGRVRVYRLGVDGTLRAIAGPASGSGTLDEGALALAARMPGDSSFYFVASVPDGTWLVAAQGADWIRHVDQEERIRTLAGRNGAGGFAGDLGPAAQARLNAPTTMTVAPDGTVYFVDRDNRRVRRVGSRYPSFAGLSDLLIASEDGARIHRFSPHGRHLDTRHALTGAVLHTFGYDAAGRLVRVTDGDGNVTTIERDGHGVPTGIVGPHGQRTRLAADANGWLARIENPAAEAHAFGYDALGRMTSMTTPRGHAQAFAYDASGRLVNGTDAAGGAQAIVRTELARSATVIGGHEVAMTTALGRVERFRVERLLGGDRREVTRFSDGTAATALHRRDGSLVTTAPDGTTSLHSRQPDPRFGMLASLTGQNERRTPGGKMRSVSEARSAVLSDPTDLLSLLTLTQTISLNGRVGTTVFTAAARRFDTTTRGGRTGTWTIDALGRPLSTRFGDLAAVDHVYDARGRLASTTAGAGTEARTWRYGYDALGQLDTISDPLGRTTRFAHDAAGRVTRQTLPDGRVLDLAYDANGNVVAIVPPGRTVHRFMHTPVDLHGGYDPPDVPGATPDPMTVAYDVDRAPTRIDRADGRSVTATYDAAGRLAAIAFSRGAIAFGYDPTSGQRVSLTAPDGVAHSLTHDGPLLTRHVMTGPVAGEIAWSHDDEFRVSGQSINGGHLVTFTYDADDLLTRAGALTLTRSPASGVLAGSSLGIVATSVTHNSHAELTLDVASVAGTEVYRARLVRDALGRVTRKVETIAGATATYDYAYDAAGRLVGGARNGAPIAYAYDVNGNRLAYSGPLGSAGNAQYDAQDRLTSYAGASFAHDRHGDRIARTDAAGTTTYRYDELGNLTRVVLPSGTVIDYVIDAMNRRVGKRVDGVLVRRWLYDGPVRIVAELDGAGALVSRFVYGTRANVPDYMTRGGATFRILTDALGSPRLVVDAASGAIAARMNHDEFGRVTEDTQPGFLPFGFAGGHYDADTGLVRFGARDYDAVTGRWTTKDPIGFAGGANLYAYVGNDPVNRIDPLGLSDTNGLKNPISLEFAGELLAAGWEKATEPIRNAWDYGIDVGGSNEGVVLVNSAGCKGDAFPTTTFVGSSQPINLLHSRMLSDGILTVPRGGAVTVTVGPSSGGTVVRARVGPGRYDISDLRDELLEQEERRLKCFDAPAKCRPGRNRRFEIMTPNAIIGSQG